MTKGQGTHISEKSNKIQEQQIKFNCTAINLTLARKPPTQNYSSNRSLRTKLINTLRMSSSTPTSSAASESTVSQHLHSHTGHKQLDNATKYYAHNNHSFAQKCYQPDQNSQEPSEPNASNNDCKQRSSLESRDTW